MTQPSFEQLFANRWFSGVAADDLQQLASAGSLRRCATNSLLYTAGEQPLGVFGVLTGSFKITQTSRDGQEAAIIVAGPGEWLGDTALFSGTPYLVGCTTLKMGQVLFVPRDAFLAFCDRRPVIYRNLLKDASVKLKQACWMGLQHKLQSPELRLAHRLQILPELLDPPREPEWVALTNRFSHELLAQMIGLSRPRTSAAMKALEQLGIVTGGHGNLLINHLRLGLFCKDSD